MKSILRTLAVGLIAVSASLKPLPAQAEEHAIFKVSEFTFKRPAKWEWVESNSPMRAAQLKINDEKSKGNAEIVFYFFGPGGAGGTQANVQRWLSQFAEGPDKVGAKTEAKTVGSTKVTYVHAEGTYSSGMPGGPKTAMPNYALLGAIIEGGQGSVFVKMTGPKDLVKGADADFKSMIEAGIK